MELRGSRNFSAAATQDTAVKGVGHIPGERAGKEAQGEEKTLEAQAATLGKR